MLRNAKRFIYVTVTSNPKERQCNNKATRMKQVIFDNIAFGQTTKQTTQRKEVLFFATAHFLFFNFIADTHLAHLVLPITQADPSQNQKSQIANRTH